MTTPMKSNHTISDLEKLYREAEECDKDAWAEMRSNLLLIAGNHYTKKTSKTWERIKDAKGIANEQKVRLTMNHIQRITKTYVNNTLMYAPGVKPMPRNENELKDQKSAELNQAVWNYGKASMDYDERVGDWCDDFHGIGEVVTKLYWDPSAGPIKAFKQKIGPDGQPMVDNQGQPVKGDPVFRGDIVAEEIYGFNLLRPRACKNLKLAPWLGIRKMVDVKELKGLVGDDEQKLKFIQESADETYVVFDTNVGDYNTQTGQVLVKEYYFRPCFAYPRGYFYITTQHGIISEGELPYGIFPIIFQSADKMQTSPRGVSIVRTVKPFQVEINRAASKMAEHQITLGDDKVLLQNGTQLSQAGVLPGIRGVSYTGMKPEIMPGRDGSQYLNYMNAQIDMMYKVAMLAEDSAGDDSQGQVDPYTLLFKSASQKKKFKRYTKRFEKFLMNVCETYLKLAKEYFQDDMLIPAVSNLEAVNIAEFRNSEDIRFQIKLDSVSEDLDTMFGQQLVLNQFVQYAGSALSKEELGKVLRSMPMANAKEITDDLTSNYDNGTNVILAMDRGELPPIREREDHDYMLKRLSNRTLKADYKNLDQHIQENYELRIGAHKEMLTQNMQQLKAMEADFIPTDGPLVIVDFYVQDPKDPAKTKRARLPFLAVQWLIQRLEQQGMSLQQLESLSAGTKAELASSYNQGEAPARAEGAQHVGGNQGPGPERNPGDARSSAGLQQPVFAQ